MVFGSRLGEAVAGAMVGDGTVLGGSGEGVRDEEQALTRRTAVALNEIARGSRIGEATMKAGRFMTLLLRVVR